MSCYFKLVVLLGAQCAQWIQGQQFQGQQMNSMTFQSHSPYSYSSAQAAPEQNNLLRHQQQMQQIQQMQQLRMPEQQRQQQAMIQQAPQQSLQQLQQQRKEDENARLWREAEEEEQQDEEKEQRAAFEQKKQQQLMQLRQQEQAHPAPIAESNGMWTKIQAAMQGVSMQVLYNIVLFAIAGSAVAFSLRKQVASALGQTKAATKASPSSTPGLLAEEAPCVDVENSAAVPVVLAEAEEPLIPKSPAVTTAKGAVYVPRPPAERVPQNSNENTPVYLCEATNLQIHKYDGIDALQKALKTRSLHSGAQGNTNCIVVSGKEAATCAQQ